MLEAAELMVFYENMLALNNVSLKAEGQKIIGIFGSNSAGKSTLMYALSGILLDILGDRETASPPAPPAGRLFVRTAIDIVTDIHRFGAFSLTGEIRYDDRK